MNWREYTRLPHLSRFLAIKHGRSRALVRADVAKHADALGLTGIPPESEVSAEGGRRRHPIVRMADGERALVRRYSRGGALRHLNPERYFLGHRAFEELRITELARSAGVCVPEVLGAGELLGRVSYRPTLVTRWIEGACELDAWLRAADEAGATAALAEAGRQIARMHELGIAHPDLNLRNLLVGRQPTSSAAAPVHLIDFDRAVDGDAPAPAPVRAANLRRLARSARKLNAPIPRTGWEALRDGYGASWPLPSDFPAG